MTQPEEYSFTRYLEAKRTVDDRALNRLVWERLVGELAALPHDRPLRVLDVGAGVGTMLERMVEWGIRHDLDYTALDSDPALLTRAAERLPIWARARGWQTRWHGSRLELDGHAQRVCVELIAEDIFQSGWREKRSWELIMAHSFLDLVNLDSALNLLSSLPGPGCLFSFTLVFDGATILRPPLSPSLDARVEGCYHRSMDERVVNGLPAGHSQTGRLLLEALTLPGRALTLPGVSILEAGGSDWVVYPPYRGDEAYFLHHILHFMEGPLRDSLDLEPRLLDEWLETRHRQVEEGKLIYIAHQLDVVGRLH
jgi:SAM-dependent methyltransferase